jgi:ribosomal protein S18 acetylase RimI-like enzyme
MDERAELPISPSSCEEGLPATCPAGVNLRAPETSASSAPGSFRTHVRRQDAVAIEDLIRGIGIFSESEIAIARELVNENLAKGEEASGYYFLLADGERGIDGYACLGPVPGAHRRCELYWIAVDPDARRRGLGRRLQHAAEDLARGLDAAYLVAETSTLPAYAAARDFYLSGGFTLIAEVPDWHDDGDGMAIFRKRL